MFVLTKVNVAKLVKNPLTVLKSLSEDDIAHILIQANEAYRANNNIISDDLYDMILEYLEKRNPKHPFLKAVGAPVPTDDNRKEELPFYMGSLNKIKGDEKEITKFTTKYAGEYIISDKLDGNSGLLYIKNGIVKLFTRGDGNIGQNISNILQYIKGIPDLSKYDGPELAVRGEIIISKATFEKLKSKGANARNMVAGMLNAKRPDLEIARSAEFVAYELIVPSMLPSQQLQYITELGFKTVYSRILQNLSNEILSDILIDRREHSPYDVDGIVVIHDKVYKRIKDKNPAYGFAFKSVHTMAKAEVIVQNVEWNLSKHGYLVPTIVFGSISLGGVTIQRATGFNGKYIEDNKIGPGSRLIIMRSGDVIPYVHEILSLSESGLAQMPEISYVWTDTKVNIMLPENKKTDNNEVKLKSFENFIKKIDIVGLGPGNIKKIFEAGINTPKFLFAADASDFLKIDGFKDKLATKIHNAIQERLSKGLDCLTLMDASNVMGRGLAGKKLELILNAYPDIMKTRYIPSLTELIMIKGVEKTTANLFIGNLPVFFKFIDDNGLQCVSAEPSAEPSAATLIFSGQKIVFTGFRDKELETYIKRTGGEIAGSVSKKTTLVIVKDINEDSGKVVKARELGIPMIQLDDFIKTYYKK